MTIVYKKIPDLPPASTLTGAELVPVSQGGVTRYTTISDVANQFQGTAGGGATSTYVDAGDAATLASAQSYTDTHIATATTTIEAYADAHDTTTLNAAKAYADSVAAGGGTPQSYVDAQDAATLSSAHGYSDSHDATTLSSAQAYADSGDAATLSSAHSYSDSHDTTTLNSAKAYTDTQIAGVSGVSTSYVDTGDANTLASAKAYANSVGGGSGTYSVGGSAPELAPAFGAWTLGLNGGAAGTVTQNSTSVTFASSQNVAYASANVTLEDNTAYDYSFTVSGYTGGSVRLLIYGNTTGHLAATSNFSANGTYTGTITTNAAGSVANAIRVQATGANGTNSFVVSALSVKKNGVGGVTRPMNDKATEIEVSVVDYGADKTGVSDSTTAFTSAMHSGAKRIHVPSGTYKVSNLVVDKNIEIFGDGVENSIINCTTTSTHGMQIIGDSTLGRSNTIILRNFRLAYTGTGQPTTANWSGLYVQRKIRAENLSIKGFTNDGIYFAPSDANESTATAGTVGNAVFFASLKNVSSKNNGRDGCWIRMGANANYFTNCDFSNNGRYGLHHSTDGGSTYGNTFIAGQCSYNKQIGWYFESGTNICMYGPYAEYNGTPTNTNTDGYTNTPYDWYFGDACSKSWFQIGTTLVLSTNNGGDNTIRLPASGAAGSIQVWVGGARKFGTT